MNSSMPFKKLSCALLLTITSSVIFAVEPSTKHHATKADDCKACHTSGDNFKPVEINARCQQCHEGVPGEGRLLAAMKQPSQASVDDGSDYGMTPPQYYETSKFGDTPHEMVLIPAGEFIMGSDNRLSDEGPQHTVTLDAYLIDKFEVTNLQYKKYIDDAGRRAPSHFDQRDFPKGKADHPVTFVSWFDAKKYCEWADKRLPTEQEWEKAARGTDGRIFPWGNTFAIEMANTPVRWETIKKEGDTSPVGAFKRGVSPFGLHDTSGNVWEWVDAWYKAHPGNEKPSENFGEIYRVLKGGSWWDCSFYKCGISAPVFNRSFFNPRVKNSSFGFRCANDVE